MAVGAVFGDGQFGGVAEEFVEDIGGVTVGGDDDLGAEGGVLIGDVGVGGDALVDEVAGQDRALSDLPCIGRVRWGVCRWRTSPSQLTLEVVLGRSIRVVERWLRGCRR